jgi:hypothetical protein
MKNENSNVKLLISEQAVNGVAIEHAIEMLVRNAIEHGVQYSADLVQSYVDDYDEASAEDVARLLTECTDDNAEYAFERFDKKPDLATKIQALKNAFKNTAPNHRIKKVTCYEFD